MKIKTCLLATTLTGVVFSLLNFANNACGAVGAVTPFTSFEAEAGTLGGGASIVSVTTAPTTQYSSPELEASGHAYVRLNAIGQSVTWTNTSSQAFTAVNLRSCIPDAPAGGGTNTTIDLYVNGVFRQAFDVNSLQNYCYEGTNYDGQTDKNPADGRPRGGSITIGFLQPARLGINVEGADHSDPHANAQSQRRTKTPHHSARIC